MCIHSFLGPPLPASGSPPSVCNPWPPGLARPTNSMVGSSDTNMQFMLALQHSDGKWQHTTMDMARHYALRSCSNKNELQKSERKDSAPACYLQAQCQ